MFSRILYVTKRILFWTVTIVLGLLILSPLIIRIPFVQANLRDAGISYLENRLQTEVDLEQIDINIFSHLKLKGLYIEDREGRTLLEAGNLSVRIRALDPFSKAIRIREVALSHSTVNIYRHPGDSAFNFTFIAEAFAGEKDPDKESSPADIEFVLKELRLERVSFSFMDSLSKKGYNAYVHEFGTSFNKFSLRDEILSVNQLEADACLFTLYRMFDDNPPPKGPPPGKEVVHIAPGDWIIEANSLALNRCFFGYENDNKRIRDGSIDFNHLGLQGINLAMSEIIYAGDRVEGFIDSLSLKEKAGFDLDMLAAGFQFDTKQINLHNLRIETPNSLVTDGIRIEYSTLNDFNRLFTDVNWYADLVNTNVSSKDLAFFSPGLKAHNTSLAINSRVEGTLNDLRLDDGKLSLGNTAFLTGQFHVTGLPDIEQTNFDAQLEPLVTDIPQLDAMLGGNIIPQEVIELGAVSFRGRVNGTINDLRVNGTAYSSIGDVIADMHLLQISGELAYSGSFTVKKMDFGALSGRRDILGTASMTATVQGVNSNDRNKVVFTTQIDEATVNGYRYTDINASGELDDKGFYGRFRMEDRNGFVDFNGNIALIDSVFDLNFRSEVEGLDLFATGLYPTPLQVSGITTIDASGTDINDFLGDAVFSDLVISDDKNTLDLKRLELHSSLLDGIRTTDLETELLKANLVGRYRVDLLPAELKALVAFYLSDSPPDSISDQDFTFDIQAKDLHEITEIFYPDIEKLNSLKLNGEFSSQDMKIRARVAINDLIYQGYGIENIAAELTEQDGHLNYFTRASQIAISEDLELPVSSIEGSILKDSISLNLKMGRDTDPERLNLYTGIHIEDSIIDLRVLPSEIFVNNERWDILPNNSITYDFESFKAENFTLTSEGRELSISSYNKGGPALRINVKNLPVGDLARIAQYDDFELSGNINGDVTLSNPFDSLSILALVGVNGLSIDGQPIGNINLTATRLYAAPRYNFNLILTGSNSMRAYGYYHDAETDTLNMRAEISKLPFVVVEPFTVGLISDLSGDAYGDFTIKGPVNDLQTTGYLEMKKGGFNFDYLGTSMTFDFQKVELLEDRIYLTTNKLFDNYGNEGWISGNIYHTSFDQFIFDSLKFHSEKFVLMDATPKENPDFFGYTTGKVDAIIDGPLEDLEITVYANPVRNEQRPNIVYIPAYGSGNVSRHNFIQFVDRSAQDTLPQVNDKGKVSVVSVNTYVNVSPDVEVRIPLSSSGTDDIKGRGFGDLFIEVNTLGKVEISGIMEISEGSYDFSFEGLATKRFIVKEGGTIVFDQDPYQAKLNLTAVYQAENVQKLGLVSDLTLTDNELQEARKTTPVDVYINIGGVLEAPEISFDIVLPAERGGGLSEFEQRLAEVKSDENELNKQVFGLLMLNQFMPKDLNAASAIGTGVNSSISDFITSQLAGYFSDWISEIIPNAEIDIGYQKIGSGDYGLESVDQNQFEVGLKQKLFDDALTIKVGGTYSYETAGSDADAGLTGDFEVEYRITPDGRVRVKAFRQSDFDAVASKNDTRTGLGLFYTKDFDSFPELFGRKEDDQ